jgi:hypothetical protein
MPYNVFSQYPCGWLFSSIVALICHLTAEQFHHHGQVSPAFIGGDAGDVVGSGAAGHELPLRRASRSIFSRVLPALGPYRTTLAGGAFFRRQSQNFDKLQSG